MSASLTWLVSSVLRIENAPDDPVLIANAQSGDRVALDRLLRAHYDRLFAVCRRMAGNDADAADATQEALLAIVRGLPRFDGRSSFRTWSYRVAVNACLDELRRRKRRPAVGLPDLERLDRPDYGVSPDDVADRLMLDAALAALPDDYRAAVVLRDVADLDYAEIAEVLQIPAGTVRSRIARGRLALARTVESQAENINLSSTGNQPSPPDRPRSAHE
jgi:RNA polymerase sigma-70 factor, ECF subfamily